VTEETITHAAGATTEAGLSRLEMERLIRSAGREPFERDAFYERVMRDGTGRVVRANRHDFAPGSTPAAPAATSHPSAPSAIDAVVASS
jgi:hypothetical protein